MAEEWTVSTLREHFTALLELLALQKGKEEGKGEGEERQRDHEP